MNENKTLIHVASITSGIEDGYHNLVLLETSGRRVLILVIGSFEAWAISTYLRKEALDIPLMYEALANSFEKFNIELEEVVIDEFVDNKYKAKLYLKNNGQREIINSRTSDAIAIAIKLNRPIFVLNSIMEESSFDLKKEKFINQFIQKNNSLYNTNLEVEDGNLEDMQKEVLNIMLANALVKEDYEKAIKIREALNKKK